MKRISGHIPEPYEEDEELELRRTRRAIRKNPARKKPRRWRKAR